MENKKILLASGCSFTFEPWNWPTFVANGMDYNLLNVGMGSTGNGLISKKVIYNVDNLLKSYNPEDIVVGVMWSGIDRNDFYIDKPVKSDTHCGWSENPTRVVDGFNNWEIVNIHWTTEKSLSWYKNFHTEIGSIIQTIQNILMVQWYLERKNVKYFMSTYMNIFHLKNMDNLLTNPDISYLYKMIDFTKFLPVSGCHEWVKENYIEEGFNKPDSRGVVGMHPTEFGHKKFAEEIIIPYINNNLL